MTVLYFITPKRKVYSSGLELDKSEHINRLISFLKKETSYFYSLFNFTVSLLDPVDKNVGPQSNTSEVWRASPF